MHFGKTVKKAAPAIKKNRNNPEKIQQFLDTGLFNKIANPDANQSPKSTNPFYILRLNDTDYAVYILLNEDENIVGIFYRLTKTTVLNKPEKMPIEKFLELIPKEIAEKLQEHIVLFNY